MDKYIKVIPYNEAAPYYNIEKVWQANWKEGEEIYTVHLLSVL